MPDTLTHEPQAEPRTRPKTAHVTASNAEWLVLAYLAADNDLEGELLADLAEMERVGSTPGVVEILAQVDRARGRGHVQGELVRHAALLRHARDRPAQDQLAPPGRSRARPTPAIRACSRASSASAPSATPPARRRSCC